MHAELSIRLLKSSDATKLSGLLRSGPPDYQKHFSPFPFDAAAVRLVLEAARRDRYWGLFDRKALLGFFMLRGFDAGYHVPSFGVSISHRLANRGLSRLALQHSISWCKLNHIEKMILKVHPENRYAKQLYESKGFKLIGRDGSKGDLLYERKL